MDWYCLSERINHEPRVSLSDVWILKLYVLFAVIRSDTVRCRSSNNARERPYLSGASKSANQGIRTALRYIVLSQVRKMCMQQQIKLY